MTDAVDRAPLLSVALVSATALAAEVALTRLFAIVHWHHFAFMIISLALLGFGASGTLLALRRTELLGNFDRSYLASIGGFAVTLLAAPFLALRLPFRAEALLWDPWQPAWLLLMYLVLAVPFFCAATAIGLALMKAGGRAGRVYAADLAGAGAGSALVLALLYWQRPEVLPAWAAAAALLAMGIGAIELRARPARWGLAAAIGLALIVSLPQASREIEPGPYKAQSQLLQVTGTRLAAETSSPLGRISIVESTRVPLRYAPGLSLVATTEPPQQLALLTDGDAMQVITAAPQSPQSLQYLAETTSALAYRLARPGRVLVPELGGTEEVLRALALGAQYIDVLELDPRILRLLSEDYASYTGDRLAQPGVRAHLGEGRGFLSGVDRRYDLVQLETGGGQGGLGGLSENYGLTVQSISLYLRNLAPGGFLSISGPVQVPPREALKLVTMSIAAMNDAGTTRPDERLIMIRGWQTFTLLVKNGAVTPDDIAALREFCDELSFDPAWFPGMTRAEANRYNQLPGPWYYDGIQALLAAGGEGFVRGYAYDIRPATDDRPFFQNFFRWRTFAQAWQTRERGGMALLEGGYLVLVLTLAQAALAGLALILLPLWLVIPLRRTPGSARRPVLFYFTAIGVAFMCLEIAFLQKLNLLLHQPTLALGVTLGTFLVAAGAGSYTADRTPLHSGGRALVLAVLGIGTLALGAALLLDAIAATLGAWPLPVRAFLAAALLAPLAFCMGLPFPLALRAVSPPLVPWAWGINGCASVLSASLATLLAVDFGFRSVLLLGIALYATLPLVFPGRGPVLRRRGPVAS